MASTLSRGDEMKVTQPKLQRHLPGFDFLKMFMLIVQNFGICLGAFTWRNIPKVWVAGLLVQGFFSLPMELSFFHSIRLFGLFTPDLRQYFSIAILYSKNCCVDENMAPCTVSRVNGNCVRIASSLRPV